MLRLFSNNVKLKLISQTISKHNFSILQGSKISEKLSFLNNEEEMRKYFNIVDLDKKQIEDKVYESLKSEQQKHSEKGREYNTLTREEIYKIYNRIKHDLDTAHETKRQFDTKFELKNQFWLDDIDFLKDKPRNYILITGVGGNNVEDIVNLCKDYGEISTYRPLRDLEGKLSMIELYYQRDEDAKKAKHYLNEYEYGNTLLLAKNYMDVVAEDIGNRTLVLEGLDKDLTQTQVLKELSKFADILRVEMPIDEAKGTKKDRIQDFTDMFYKSLENDASKPAPKSGAYILQVNRLIGNFKKAMAIEKINDDALLNNLLVNVKFYLKKFYPQEYVNDFIRKELDTIYVIRRNPLQDHKVKLTEAYEKIISNLEKLIRQYEDRMAKLSSPVTADNVIIDMYGNNFDPEKLDRDLLNKPIDEKADGIEIKSKITEMEFYATFNPLSEQIARFNFIRSLTDDEKNLLKDKHDIDLAVNVPNFIDYFQKFTKAIGIEMIDKYLQLSQLYISMSPADKLFFGRSLAKQKIRPDEYQVQDYLLEFLGIRKYRKFSTPSKIREITNTHSKHPRVKDKDNYLRTVMNNLFDKLPRLTNLQLTRLLIREGSIYSKIGYMRFIRSVNLKKKKDFVSQIRNRISRFNNQINEINSYYKILLEQNPKAKAELGHLIAGVMKYKFAETQSGVPDEMDFESNYEIVKEEINTKGKNRPTAAAAKKMESLDINQIKNRIDLLKIDRMKIINSISNLMDNKLYKNRRFEILDDKIRENLLHYVKTVIRDDPALQVYYIDKIEGNLEKFKYVESNNKGFREHKYTLLEMAENIIQKEMEYNLQVNKVRTFIETCEGNFSEKINKSNLIQALSAYSFVNDMRQVGYDKLNRLDQGSPVINYFNNVRELFDKEVEKLNSLKAQEVERSKEYSIDQIYNKRKELIENYTNKIAAYEEEINRELNDYKLKELVDESGLDKEMKKKDYEVNENRKHFGTQHEEEYKDISYLLSNLNKLGKENNFEKVNLLLKFKKQSNKGYAFVTFTTSDEAKIMYSLAKQVGLFIKDKQVKVSPKFDRTHAHFQLEQTIQLAKGDAKIINKRRELEEAERGLNQFEKEWRDMMDKKQTEHNNVLNAYKDLFSDPFKKHDRHNPFEDDEEEEVRSRMLRQEKLLGVDNTWLFEDDKIDKLRRSKENRLTKKYLDHELLKRGLIPDNVIKKSDYLQPSIDDLYAENTEIKITPEVVGSHNGRVGAHIDNKTFIEKYMGKDGLHQSYTPLGGSRDKITREVKELRERFPKEKFINSPEQSDSLLAQINSTYLRLINDTEDVKDTKYELYDRISPMSPINKKIQAVLNQRDEYLENEEQRQMITLETFFQKMSNSLARDDSKFSNVPENVINEQKKKDTFYKNNPGLYDIRKFTGEEVEIVPETFEFRKKFVKKTEEVQDDDFVKKIRFKKVDKEERADDSNSFKSFLNRRRATAPAKKDTQFDPKGFNLADIGMAKLESIREKYNKHIVTPLEKKSVYSYIKGSKRNNADERKVEDLDKKLKIEKRKAEFLKELEENFQEELEALPSFREYFQGLKEGIKTKRDESDKVEPLQFSYNYRDNSLDNLREKLAILYTGKVDSKTFEEIFAKDQNAYKSKLDTWVTEQDQEYFWKFLSCKLGLTREEILQKADEMFPEIAGTEDVAEIKEYIKTLNEEKKYFSEVEKLEDINDDEYYFNPECGQTLEEHLAHLSKLEYKNVTLRADKDGRVIIRREYKGNYRYDLDEVMNFDINAEREKMRQKLKAFDFEANLDNSAEFYSQMIAYMEKKQITPIFNDAVIANAEEIISQRYGLEGFSLIDLKNCIANLTNLPGDKIKQLITDLKRITDFGGSSGSVNNELTSINEFSVNLFNEKEIRILSALLRDLNSSEINKLNLDGVKKYIFIQDVLLGSLLNQLNILLKNDSIAIYVILKLLPEATTSNPDVKKSIKYILWDKYKQFMKNTFTITLKKEGQINPGILHEDINELQRVMIALDKQDYHNRDEEIKQYSKKLKGYYAELSKAESSSVYDNLISDEELFIEEITEQVNTRLERLKKKGEASKPKVNEETLFNRQLDYINKLDKKYEAMSYTEDKDFFNEIKRKKNLNAVRKEKLVKEGRPIIDYNLPRLL
jgi:hypothetical protein